MGVKILEFLLKLVIFNYLFVALSVFSHTKDYRLVDRLLLSTFWLIYYWNLAIKKHISDKLRASR
jgi:hypothetical protein